MEPNTAALWARQDRHEGDRHRLFAAVAAHVDAATVLYPGSFVDVAPSFVLPEVTYLDSDARARRFFADVDGVRELVARHGGPSDARIRFVHGDYADDHQLPDEGFDLLVSLYAGFVSEHCTRYLRVGGTLLVNPSHGDASMAAIDPRYELSSVVVARAGDYRVRTTDLDVFLVPKVAQELTVERLHEVGRGIAYTRSAFAYLFTRVE